MIQTPLFRHAAVAVDPLESGELLVESLEGFKAFGTQKITLVTVVSISEPAEEEMENRIHQEKLDKFKKLVEEQGFEVETDLRSGVYYYPPTEILESAEEHQADYIIVGSHGPTKVREMLLGSTASEILQRSALPVFLLRMGIQESQEHPGERSLVVRSSVESALQHVLHATDFSETADRAFEVVRSLDKQAKIQKISLIHVQGHHAIALKDPVSLNKLTEKTTLELEDMRNLLSDSTREECELIITYGTPGKEIVKAAEENGVNLIVMGSQGKGFVHEFFLGGVSSQVTRFSSSHVIVVPAKR